MDSSATGREGPEGYTRKTVVGGQADRATGTGICKPSHGVSTSNVIAGAHCAVSHF